MPRFLRISIIAVRGTSEGFSPLFPLGKQQLCLPNVFLLVDRSGWGIPSAPLMAGKYRSSIGLVDDMPFWSAGLTNSNEKGRGGVGKTPSTHWLWKAGAVVST